MYTESKHQTIYSGRHRAQRGRSLILALAIISSSIASPMAIAQKESPLQTQAKQVQAGAAAILKQSGLHAQCVVANGKLVLIIAGRESSERIDELEPRLLSYLKNWQGVVLQPAYDIEQPDYTARNKAILDGVQAILAGSPLIATIGMRDNELHLLIFGSIDESDKELIAHRLKLYRKSWGDIFSFEFSTKVPTKVEGPTTISTAWQLHYFHSEATFDGLQKPDEFVGGLNYLFGADRKTEGGKVRDPFAEFKNATVWMRGTGQQIDRSRALLCLFDARSPVVNSTAYAFQIAGDERRIATSSEIARASIERAQNESLALVGILTQAAMKWEGGTMDPVVKALDIAGLSMDLDRPMSVLRILIRIATDKDRAKILKEADAIIRAEQKEGRLLGIVLPKEKEGSAFSNLSALLANGDGHQLDTDRTSIIDFLVAAVHFDEFVELSRKSAMGVSGDPAHADNRKLVSAPEELQKTSESVDRHLDHLTAAYAADLEAMIIRPMLDYVRKNAAGTALNGRVSVLVASGRNASATTELVSYSQTQITKSLDDTLFKLIAPPGAGGTANESVTEAITKFDVNGNAIPPEPGKEAFKTTTKTTTTANDTGLSGLPKLLAAMPQGQAAILAGLLTAADEQRFVRVAPGVSLQLTPVVGPDHLTADVKITTSFGIETTLEKTSDADNGKFPLPDAVKKHTVSTVAPIAGFGLTGISSLEVQSRVPQPAASIPLLGQIPLIGQIFRFPQAPKVTRHQSYLLVSNTVTPRVLGLMQYYSVGSGRGQVKQRFEDYIKQTESHRGGVEKQTSTKDVIDLLGSLRSR